MKDWKYRMVQWGHKAQIEKQMWGKWEIKFEIIQCQEVYTVLNSVKKKSSNDLNI